MEVDEIQRLQVCKFQRLISSNPNKIATQKANHQYLDEDAAGGGGSGGRLCGWPSSRIVRVSRASGGKDRHSKVLTSKGLRDRRVRLSVTTAIQFYDLQDRLGYDQPSKAIEWLIKAASNSIAELPSLDPSFSQGIECNQDNHYRKVLVDNKKKPETEFEDPNNRNDQRKNDNNISVSGSSTSETSKGSGLSLSRSEIRMRARERAREMAAKKEKRDHPIRVNGVSENPSFTDLLTGGGISGGPATVGSNTGSNPVASPESRIQWTTPMDYFFGHRPPPPPQFNITAGENHHYSFLQENFAPVVTATGGGGGGFGPGFNRGTLQSNLLSVLPHNHQQFQRFQSSSMVDGSTSTNFPFFLAPNIGSATPENYPAATGYDSQRLQLYGGAQSDDRKEKSKN